MSFEHDYSTQTQADKLRRLAAYHAAKATEINKANPGWTHEASFHWESAVDLIAAANRQEHASIKISPVFGIRYEKPTRYVEVDKYTHGEGLTGIP